MTRTLIVEDEEPAARRLEKLLKKLDSEVEIVAITDTVEVSVNWLSSNPRPDLIMLDIQLGDGLSFDIFRKIKVDSYVIFTTAYDEYAIKAFELNSIDYLLKPVDEIKLSNSLQKFHKLRSSTQSVDIEQLLMVMEKRKDKFKKRFVVNIASKIKLVEIRAIAFFISKEKNTFLCTFDNRYYPLEFSLDQIGEMLDPEYFFRVNRQYIISYRTIEKIDILSKSRIRITTNPNTEEEIMVSTARSSDFRIWLDR